jgi:Fimbrial assembly protein (PilN)
LIEVNLIPGGKRRRGGGGIAIPMPDFSKIPMDPYSLGAGIASVVSIGLIVWMFMGIGKQREELELALVDARADSASFADIIANNKALAARRDSVAEKVSIIQEIDAGRYVWPHIMDEVGRALPDFTWLISLVQISVGETIEFEIQGRAGNLFAMTRFMENLESSPFIRRVRPITSDQTPVVDPNGDSQLVYAFTLEMEWEEPPLELLQTIPLFGGSTGTAMQAQVDSAQVDPAGLPDDGGNGEGG